MRPILKILVPTDFSSCAEEALHHAIRLARKFDANVTLLNVYSMPALIETQPISTVSAELMKGIEEASQVHLAKLKATVEKDLGSGARVQVASRLGVPYATIAEEAKVGNFDLIVIGTHGRTGLNHFFIGSVAERVVRLAPCPVLTVHEPKPRPL